jgi:hypothetical protein
MPISMCLHIYDIYLLQSRLATMVQRIFFLYFALYLTLDRTTGEAIKDWILILWLCACLIAFFIRFYEY